MPNTFANTVIFFKGSDYIVLCATLTTLSLNECIFLFPSCLVFLCISGSSWFYFKISRHLLLSSLCPQPSNSEPDECAVRLRTASTWSGNPSRPCPSSLMKNTTCCMTSVPCQASTGGMAPRRGSRRGVCLRSCTPLLAQEWTQSSGLFSQTFGCEDSHPDAQPKGSVETLDSYKASF